jgi:Phage protein D
MSNNDMARRTEINITIDGVDITTDINKHLLQMTYTDHEEDKTDDLQLSLDDREGTWLSNWLAGADGGEESTKGAILSAILLQKNWESNGSDRILDCGSFEIDSLDASGPPATVSIKATSLPYSSTVRTERKTKAWEKIKLSAIANEIASKNGMNCMFESSLDPLYIRREQVQISDIVFLQGLCKDAGISLKVTAKTIVLFDEAEYEQKPPVRKIERGIADVISYRFGTSSNDTKYSKCHVIYTDPKTKQKIEYTYTPRGSDPKGQILEINEKVNTREEARQLAMKRLRQKNKSEFQAEFSLVGDTRLVAGVTVEVNGYGMFDGKYIIETATHNVTASGYSLQIKLRRVLEGY